MMHLETQKWLLDFCPTRITSPKGTPIDTHPQRGVSQKGHPGLFPHTHPILREAFAAYLLAKLAARSKVDGWGGSKLGFLPALIGAAKPTQSFLTMLVERKS